MIYPVERDRVLDYWPDARPLINKALAYAHGEFTDSDILQYLLSRDMQMWIAKDEKVLGAAITQIVNYPRLRSVRVILMGGEDAFDNWFSAMLNTIESWARQVGATRLEESGRDGWIRLGNKYGYSKGYTLMYKNLGGI